jgi:Putative prokaryotic signal transducing protein
MSALLTTAGTRPRADLICHRLDRAGIDAVAKPRPSLAGARDEEAHDIYVREADLGRAQEVLREDVHHTAKTR